MKKELKSGILSADKSADDRPINRPTVGRLSFGLMYNQILSEASFGLVKGCIRFWVRSDQTSGFYGNR